jgi:hypothetical protein
VVLLAAAVLLFEGFLLPPVMQTPLDNAPGVPRALLPHGPLRPLDFLTGDLCCFPLALVIPIAGVAVAGIDMLLGGRPRVPLYLVVTTKIIGLVFVPLLVATMSRVPGFRPPLYVIVVNAGLWLTLGGYLAAFLECFLARHRGAQPLS